MSKKSISKTDLGLTPTKKKGNLTTMELRELRKATEMALEMDIIIYCKKCGKEIIMTQHEYQKNGENYCWGCLYELELEG